MHTAWNLRSLRAPEVAPAAVAERVSVLVPARDEGGRIAACLDALLAGSGVPDLEILVLDDASTDDTAELVGAVEARDGRVRLLPGGTVDPPAGWLGKPYACHRLAAAATGTVLAFVDADVRLAPEGLAATVQLLRGSGLDLVCPYPRQLADGPLPRLVQPLLQWSWLTFLPLRLAESSGRPALTAANGQLLACDAAAYRAVGGHACVRASVLDDVELLRAFVRAGFRGVVADGTGIAECRMYDSAGALVDGYTKSLWAAFGSPAGALGVAALLGLLYVAPAVLAIAGPGRTVRLWGAAGYLAGVAGRALVARRTGQRGLPDILAHPVSIVAFTGLLAMSWHRRRAGTLTWRGRPIR